MEVSYYISLVYHPLALQQVQANNAHLIPPHIYWDDLLHRNWLIPEHREGGPPVILYQSNDYEAPLLQESILTIIPTRGKLQ